MNSVRPLEIESQINIAMLVLRESFEHLWIFHWYLDNAFSWGSRGVKSFSQQKLSIIFTKFDTDSIWMLKNVRGGNFPDGRISEMWAATLKQMICWLHRWGINLPLQRSRNNIPHNRSAQVHTVSLHNVLYPECRWEALHSGWQLDSHPFPPAMSLLHQQIRCLASHSGNSTKQKQYQWQCKRQKFSDFDKMQTWIWQYPKFSWYSPHSLKKNIPSVPCIIDRTQNFIQKLIARNTTCI